MLDRSGRSRCLFGIATSIVPIVDRVGSSLTARPITRRRGRTTGLTGARQADLPADDPA
jgi:hypothetical protein